MLSGANAQLGHMCHASSFGFRKTALEQTLKKTGIKEFDIQTESVGYWKTLDVKKNHTILKIRKRLGK